jgi:hypothetical protein
MHRRLAWTLTAAFLAFGAIALADSPTTTQTSADPVDTFRQFLLDIQQGDPKDVARVCFAQNADARQLRQDFQSLAAAMGELHRAAAQKWGADAADSVLPSLPSLSDLDDVAVKTVGDHAEVGGGSVWLVHLVRVDNRWLLDLDWLAQSDDMPGNSRWFAAMASAVHRTADDISTGRLTTIESVTEAIQARQQAIPDTTEPTTQAATQP